MDLVNLLRLLRRQRVLVAVLAVASIAALVFTFISVPVTYRASGSAVLLNPQTTATATSPGQTVPSTGVAPDNPYAKLNDMSVVLDIVTRRMNTPSVITRLSENGVDSFTLGANLDFYRGPILDYSADGKYQEDAVRGAAVVREEIQRQLAELQSQQGVAPSDFIRLDDAVTAQDTTTIITSKVRIMIAAGLACALIILSSALLADARRKRRAEEAEGQPLATTTALPTPGTFQVPTMPSTPTPAPTPTSSAAARQATMAETQEPSYWSAQR